MDKNQSASLFVYCIYFFVVVQIIAKSIQSTGYSIMPALILLTAPLEDALLPRMDVSEVADRIGGMRQQEETAYLCHDYLAITADVRSTARKPVDEDCRVKMTEWSYQVVDFCKFRRETVAIGMSFLDRFLSTPAGIHALLDRKSYQLAAMTTLYMAIKLHEPIEMETSLLADLSRGCYNEVEIAEMEGDILEALRWRVMGPTPLAFVQHFLALLPSNIHASVANAVMDYARFQTELAVSDYSFVVCPYSHIAMASVLNAVEGIDRNLFPLKQQGKFLRTLENFSGIMVEQVAETQTYLNNILVDVFAVDESPQSSVHAKTSPDSVARTGIFRSPSKNQFSQQPGHAASQVTAQGQSRQRKTSFSNNIRTKVNTSPVGVVAEIGQTTRSRQPYIY